LIIGYVAQKFPQLTLTFVYREVIALRAAGLQIETFSIWKPKLEELSEEAKELVDSTFYIFPLNLLQFGLNQLWYLFTRPRRYLGSLWFCVTRDHKSFKNRVRTFFHFFQAVHMAKEVEARKVQHLHVHFALNAATIALVISRLTGITYSFTAHANDIFVNPILLPEKIKEAKFIIGISEYNKNFLYNILPTQETLNKIHPVRYGVDVKHFAPPGQRPRGEKPIIFSVARLVEKKGFPYLVKACQLLVERGYDFQCVIAGGGPQEGLLRQMIEENNLSEYVKLVGVVFQEHLRDLFWKADIFVLPCVIAGDQDRDGIPNTLIEAMAMEIPTVSTTVSGIPELIEDGKTGLLAEPRDAESLARAIARLLDDPELRSTLAKAGRAKVIAEFETEKNAQALYRIFASYLQEKPIPPAHLPKREQGVVSVTKPVEEGRARR
jgi:glycosyltransferase involved in cell wall biosynthesis